MNQKSQQQAQWKYCDTIFSFHCGDLFVIHSSTYSILLLFLFYLEVPYYITVCVRERERERKKEKRNTWTETYALPQYCYCRRKYAFLFYCIFNNSVQTETYTAIILPVQETCSTLSLYFIPITFIDDMVDSVRDYHFNDYAIIAKEVFRITYFVFIHTCHYLLALYHYLQILFLFTLYLSKGQIYMEFDNNI